MAFTEKISIVVADGHTLGYINQSDPAHLFTFREIQSLGAQFHAFDGARLVSNYEKSQIPKPPSEKYGVTIKFTHDEHVGSRVIEYFDVWFFEKIQ